MYHIDFIQKTYDNNPEVRGVFVDASTCCNGKCTKNIAEALERNSTLRYLDFRGGACRGRTIPNELLTTIINILKKNKIPLQYLNLGYSRIDDEYAKALADALKTNTTLIFLNVYGNPIYDDGLKALAEVLEINSTLKWVCTCYSYHNDVGIREKLKSYDLGPNSRFWDYCTYTIYLKDKNYGSAIVVDAEKDVTNVDDYRQAYLAIDDFLNNKGALYFSEMHRAEIALELFEYIRAKKIVAQHRCSICSIASLTSALIAHKKNYL